MIKKLRVTVDGRAFDVTVEIPDESVAPVTSAPHAPVVASAPAPAVTPAPVQAPAVPKSAPAPAPISTGAAPQGGVPSPLAGRVTAVVVAAGQEVKEGDHLVTLEAMKMNTFVFAPRSGKVAEIKTAVGDAVEEGQVLVTIH